MSKILGTKRIRVRVPATTSNLGPGFDVLGMALKLYCELELKAAWPDLRRPSWKRGGGSSGRGQIRVEIEGEGAGELPEDDTNLIVKSFRRVLPASACTEPLLFKIKNGIPLSRGLGSSAAARLCGLLAANTLRPRRSAPVEKLVDYAVKLEGHPDNVMPAFHGGMQASLWEDGRTEHYPVRIPKGLGVVVCIPDFEVSTEKARKSLPPRVSFQIASKTSARLAFLIGAFERGELRWLREAMQDVLHQPHRARLVKGMNKVIAAANKAGAYGAALSGSGPTILAFTPPGPKQAQIGRAMQKAFFAAGVESRYLALDVDLQGARVTTR
jgi:homoserine kinase